MKQDRIERRPIRDVVYKRLLAGILNGKYKPGDRLREETLAEELGVSSTPVREALRKLEVERFVDYYPRKGTVVSEIPRDEVEELYKVRQLLEVLIIRRSAQNATPKDITKLRKLLASEEMYSEPDDVHEVTVQFNRILLELSRADNLIALMKRVRESLNRVFNRNYLDPERRRRAREEHVRIVDALEAHDADLAEKLIVEHLHNSMEPALKQGLTEK